MSLTVLKNTLYHFTSYIEQSTKMSWLQIKLMTIQEDNKLLINYLPIVSMFSVSQNTFQKPCAVLPY